MTSEPARTSADLPPPGVDTRAAAIWHAVWALGAGLGAGLMLTFLGRAPGAALAALGCGAAPGILGWLLKPANGNGVILLALWSIFCALAMALTGGVSGPLMAWAAGPILAGAVLGGLWRDGAMFSFATLAGVGFIQAAGTAGPVPPPMVSLWLGLTSLATTLAGASAALMLLNAGRAARAASPPAASPRSEHERETSVIRWEPLSSPMLNRRALEERLAEAEAARDVAESDARAKMRFLANMSHELRTPLNAIMGFSDIMRSRLFGDLPPKYAEYSELIHESGRHLLDLINDVLDMSKIEADKYELSRHVFDIREPVNAALRILRVQADEAGVQLRGVLPLTDLDVDADARAIKQIVLNLVSNALKFTPAGGSVTVAVQAAPDGRILELTTSDTGVGIAPEDLERLGRPYEQAGDADRRSRGTGLGLTLVKAFARLHGGDVAIESRLGEGTAVTVRLPVIAPSAAGTAAGPQAESSAPQA